MIYIQLHFDKIWPFGFLFKAPSMASLILHNYKKQKMKMPKQIIDIAGMGSGSLYDIK
jgi:hypothetical protein